MPTLTILPSKRYHLQEYMMSSDEVLIHVRFSPDGAVCFASPAATSIVSRHRSPARKPLALGNRAAGH
jgi:hypothetical protein